MTRKRDFVDRCVSGAGRLGRCLGEEGDGSGPQASAWADQSEAWERAGESRRVTGTSWESCSKFVSSLSSSYREVWGGAGHASEFDNALEEKRSFSIDTPCSDFLT